MDPDILEYAANYTRQEIRDKIAILVEALEIKGRYDTASEDEKERMWNQAMATHKEHIASLPEPA